MNRLNISSGGDIFIQRARKKHLAASGHPTHGSKLRIILRNTGIILSMILIVFLVNGFAVTSQKSAQAQSAAPVTPGIMQFLPQANTSVKPVKLAQTPSNTQDTTPNATEPPASTPRAAATPVPVEITPVPNIDFQGAINQINQLNVSIGQNMQACIQLAAQTQAQIVPMRVQERQMQAAVTDLNNRIRAITGNDQNAQTARFQLSQQRDQINFQRNQLIAQINFIKSQYNRSRADCTKSVNAQITAKRNLENQLQRAYSSALNVRLP